MEISDDYFFELIKKIIREGKEIGKKEIDEKLIAEKETALRGIEERLPIKLEIAKKKGDAFWIKAESRILKLTPAGLEELLDEEGVKVKVVETEDGFNVVVQ